MNVQLPNLFRGTPDGGGEPRGAQGVTVEVAATASNDRGVFFSGRGRLDTLYLAGKITLKNLEIAIDQGAGHVPRLGRDQPQRQHRRAAGPEPGRRRAADRDRRGRPQRAVRHRAAKAFDRLPSELSVRVHPIVFLQRVGAELSAAEIEGRPFAVLSGNAGIFGPKLDIPLLFEGEVASIDGTIRLSVPTFLPPESFSIEVEGIGKLVEFKVASARVKYTTPSRVDMDGRLDLTAGGFGALGGDPGRAGSTAKTSQFNVEAFGALRVPGSVSVKASTSRPRPCSRAAGTPSARGAKAERSASGGWAGGALNTFLNSVRSRRLPGRRRTGRWWSDAFSVRSGTRVLAVAVPRRVRAAEGRPVRPVGRLGSPPRMDPNPSARPRASWCRIPTCNTTWFGAAPPGGRHVARRGQHRHAGRPAADPLPPISSARGRVSGRGARADAELARAPGRPPALCSTSSALGFRRSCCGWAARAAAPRWSAPPPGVVPAASWRP